MVQQWDVDRVDGGGREGTLRRRGERILCSCNLKVSVGEWGVWTELNMAELRKDTIAKFNCHATPRQYIRTFSSGGLQTGVWSHEGPILSLAAQVWTLESGVYGLPASLMCEFSP